MILYIVLTIILAIAIYVYVRWTSKTDLDLLYPHLQTKYWKDTKVEHDESINPFTINVSEKEIANLHDKIENTRFPVPSLKSSNFRYGMRDNVLKEFLNYWRKDYDWKTREARMNEFEHFKTNIEGLDVHFIHQKPKSSNFKPTPILMVHGWPGSFVEMMKIMPMLQNPSSYGGNEKDAFTVVCPSIPGYGFSDCPEKEGFNAYDCARVFDKLMLRLGYKKYFVQGGDWGSLIVQNMALMYPSHVRGVHFTLMTSVNGFFTFLKMGVGSIFPSLFYKQVEAEKLFPLKSFFKQMLVETGYMHLQATKPDTVGFALSDSPSGLAAYILEKFSSWTDMKARDTDCGLLDKYWSKDELLDNIMIYWLNNNITSSMRFYKENFGNLSKSKIYIPAGYAWVPNELSPGLKDWVQQKCQKLVHFTYMKEGGHFLAFQLPQLLAEDIALFVNRVQKIEATPSPYEKQDIQNTMMDRFEVKG